MSRIYYTVPGADVCAANVAHMVTEYARTVWADMFANDESHYVTLPGGGAVILSTLTSTQAAIMPQVTYTRDSGETGYYTPDSHSVLSRGATLRGDLTPLGDGHAIGLVCERARRATAKGAA